MTDKPHELTCILAQVNDIHILCPVKALKQICFFEADFSQPLIVLSDNEELDIRDVPAKPPFAYMVFDQFALPMCAKPQMITVKYGDFIVDYENTYPGMQLCVTVAGNQAWIPDLNALSQRA